MTSRQGEKLEQIQGQLLPQPEAGAGAATRGPRGPCSLRAGCGCGEPGRPGEPWVWNCCGKSGGRSVSSRARESRPIPGVRELGKSRASQNARRGVVLRIIKDKRPLRRARRARRALSREEEPRTSAACVAGQPGRPSLSPAPQDRRPRPAPRRPGWGGGGGRRSWGGRPRLRSGATYTGSSIPPAGLGSRAGRAAAVWSRAPGASGARGARGVGRGVPGDGSRAGGGGSGEAPGGGRAPRRCLQRGAPSRDAREPRQSSRPPDPRAAQYLFILAEEGGASVREKKIFPGSLYLSILELLAAACSAGAGGQPGVLPGPVLVRGRLGPRDLRGAQAFGSCEPWGDRGPGAATRAGGGGEGSWATSCGRLGGGGRRNGGAGSPR